MTRREGLVLDVILLRAVFGQRVRELLEAFEDIVTFYSPDLCFDDARKYILDCLSSPQDRSASGTGSLGGS
jgi:hypothetical protein